MEKFELGKLLCDFSIDVDAKNSPNAIERVVFLIKKYNKLITELRPCFYLLVVACLYVCLFVWLDDLPIKGLANSHEGI